MKTQANIPDKTDLIEWINHLKRASHDMIVEDNILQKAPAMFQQCEDMATKSDGIHCDGDEGAFTLMSELFCNCLYAQFGRVEYAFLEMMPPMSPKWKLHREIWTYRFLMYQRFQLGDGKIRELCNQLEDRIRTGRIQTVAANICKDWLMTED